MRRMLHVLLILGMLLPLGAAKKHKVYPMMLGPKISVGMFEGDESIYPITVSADMLLNLYRNYFWLRTDPLALVIQDGGDQFSINTGAPFDFVFMGKYQGWRPYGFGGFEIDVTAAGENTVTLAGLDIGGGLSYEAALGLHIFGEAGIDIEYMNPSLGDDFDFRLFLALGARFAFIW